jgi:nicotinamide-nucleotide amidase
MTKDSAAQEIARLLGLREEKMVLGESCTGGLVAATLTQIPGISQIFCGSVVTYQPKAKRKWLGVRRSTIRNFTSESPEVAAEMAMALLAQTPSADWSLAVVGHLGPNAPEDKDGHIYVCCARRTKKNRIKLKDAINYICKAPQRDEQQGDEGDGGDNRKKIISLRVSRQEEATEVALTLLARNLHKRIEQDNRGGEPKPKAKKKDKSKKRA